jgi:hypothetical protein
VCVVMWMWIDYWNVLRLVDENEILTWCVCDMMDIWKVLNEAQSHRKWKVYKGVGNKKIGKLKLKSKTRTIGFIIGTLMAILEKEKDVMVLCEY